MSSSEHGGHHIVPRMTYLKVFGALLVLTILTVAVYEMPFGPILGIIVAVMIAAAKASLVVMYFMGLKYDTRVNTLVFLTGIGFVAIFLAFTLIDTAYRTPEPPSEEQQIEQTAPASENEQNGGNNEH